MRIVVSVAFLSAAIMVISDAAARNRVQSGPLQRIYPVSDVAQPAPRVTLQCKPEKSGNELSFSYTVTNEGPGDVYVADAFHRVDPATHTASADRDAVVIALQPDSYALVLRGIPPRPPYPVTRPIFPLTHRLRPGERLDRRMLIPLPLAETSPYQPYGNVRDYVLKPIDGVVLAVDWIAAGSEGFVATPAIGAEQLFTIHATNLLRDMRRLTSRFPTRGLSILQRAPKG
jgi:hypothetical protein